MIVASEDVTDDGDEELRNGFAVKEKHDCFFESFDFCSDVVSFERFFDFGCECWCSFVEVNDEAA